MKKQVCTFCGEEQKTNKSYCNPDHNKMAMDMYSGETRTEYLHRKALQIQKSLQK